MAYCIGVLVLKLMKGPVPYLQSIPAIQAHPPGAHTDCVREPCGKRPVHAAPPARQNPENPVTG